MVNGTLAAIESAIATAHRTLWRAQGLCIDSGRDEASADLYAILRALEACQGSLLGSRRQPPAARLPSAYPKSF